MRIPVAVMLCGAVLAGCSGLRSSRPAEQVYVLHASPAAAAPARQSLAYCACRDPRFTPAWTRAASR